MKAVAKCNPIEPGIDVIDVQQPNVESPTDVIVQVSVSGISGSELNIWRGVYRLPGGQPISAGRILGYEHAGIVRDSGSVAQAAGFNIGQRVALGTPFIGCGYCEPCQQGLINLCRSWEHIGITLDGTDTEIARLPMAVLQLLPDNIDLLEGAFLNTAALAVRAVTRGGLVPGDRIVIIGPGPVGLLMLQVARTAGASWIGVVGQRNDVRRLEIGRLLGADAIFNNPDEATAGTEAATDGLGAEVVLEAAGTADGIALAVSLVKVGGTVVLTGLPPKHLTSIEAVRVTRDEISIRGVEGNLLQDRYRALRLMARGDIHVYPLVTHRLKIDEAPAAFQIASSGNACKVVFVMDDKCTNS